MVIARALSIGSRPITATRHGPLTSDTVRLIGTFKRGVPRNKSATFSWLAGGNLGGRGRERGSALHCLPERALALVDLDGNVIWFGSPLNAD
jgi:hypothetical protein